MQQAKYSASMGFIWKLAQNFSTQLISFIIQIVLARILLPEDYSVIAIISVFTALANVIINTGFSSALIQRQDVSDIDYTSAFYSGIFISIVLFVILYAASPLIAAYYEMPEVNAMLRVASLSIIIAALSSVHHAIVTKHMTFNKTLVASAIGCILQGTVGIILALEGVGAWSLVVSHLVNSLVVCIVLWCLVDWRPQRTFSFRSVRKLLSFSIKVLTINLINTLYNNIISLVIGKAYSKDSLAFYNRGFQFPTLIMVNVDGAMTTVLFSSLSRLQDDNEKFMTMLRKSLRMSLYICTPLMLGLFVVAEPMISFLLTDKWLGAVPYVRICSLTCMLWPLSAVSHAIIAKGNGTIALALNIIAKAVGIISLIVAVRFNVYVFVMSSLFASLITQAISMAIYKKILDYGFWQQIKDIVRSTWRAIIMTIVVWPISLLQLSAFIKLMLMVLTGIIIYIILSLITKSEEYTMVKEFALAKFSKCY